MREDGGAGPTITEAAQEEMQSIRSQARGLADRLELAGLII